MATASLGGLCAVLLGSVVSYHELTGEQRVAIIDFTENAPREYTYTARLMLDNELDRLLTVNGDEWQLDARVVSWKPPATILGLEPIYQLERLSGRYADIGREISEPRTVHSLVGENPLDVWRIARRFPVLLPGVDAYYGTATYLPMADGARYEAMLSRDAPVARPVNEAARDAVGGWAPGRLQRHPPWAATPSVRYYVEAGAAGRNRWCILDRRRAKTREPQRPAERRRTRR